MSKKNLLCTVTICVMLLCLFAPFSSAEEDPFSPANKDLFISDDGDQKLILRLDSSDPEGELENLRLITKGRYKFHDIPEKFGALLPNYHPPEDGLDTLNASASAQFSEAQFRKMAKDLREVAKGKKVYIIDTREECHGFINGIPVSWYGKYNWANVDKKAEEIEKEEKERLDDLVGKTVTACDISSDKLTDKRLTIKVSEVKTERELVESEGFNYLRIPCTDHVWPKAEKFDMFFDLIKTKGTDNIWPHFHCKAGEGRTGAFITAYDMIKNTDVGPLDIILRQTALGSGYLLYQGSGTSWKEPLRVEKIFNLVLLWNYIIDNASDNFETPWSELTKEEYSYASPWEAAESMEALQALEDLESSENENSDK